MTDPLDELRAEGSDAAQASAADLIGRTISDRYKILDLLAMGGMGAVYRAEHLLMRKHVAVKVLHARTAGFPELVERFEREAVAGAHINHPNVAIANDFGVFDGDSRFLVLEFIRGVTLRDLMSRGPLPAPRAARIVRQVAAALAAVHEKGIVHRDIKPGNIMIVDDTRSTRQQRRNPGGVEDVVKLIDFGLSKVPVEKLSSVVHDGESDRALTAAGVIMGTIGYLAPEAALGMRSVLAPADLYSLGVIFYEMLCGKQPFEGTDIQVFAQHRNKPVPPIAERNPEVSVPIEIETIVQRLLEKDPDCRYADANALIEALDAVIGRKGVRSIAAPALTPQLVAGQGKTAAREGLGPQRRAWLLALLVIVAGIVVVLVGRTRTMKAESSAVVAAAVSDAASSLAAPGNAGARATPPRAPSVVDRLRAAAEAKDSVGAADVFLAIADNERAAFGDRAVQTEATSVARIAAGGRSADAVFDRLGNDLGTDGLDILYDLAARERSADSAQERTSLAPPTGAGARARAILGQPAKLARATPAMRIAYELRTASCEARPKLFPRAASDGDDRALELLKAMQLPRCGRTDGCCFGKDHNLERAIAEIQARLRR